MLPFDLLSPARPLPPSGLLSLQPRAAIGLRASSAASSAVSRGPRILSKARRRVLAGPLFVTGGRPGDCAWAYTCKVTPSRKLEKLIVVPPDVIHHRFTAAELSRGVQLQTDHVHVIMLRVAMLRIVLGLCDHACIPIQDRPETYKLWSDDGAYEQELAVRDSGDFSANHVVLEFVELLPDRTYSLACDFHGDGIYDQTLFEKVPYERLLLQCMEGARADELKFEPPEDTGEPEPEDILDASIEERNRANEGSEAR